MLFFVILILILILPMNLHPSTKLIQLAPTLCRLTQPMARDGKMFQRASNAGVNFFLARVKFVPNFTLFCHKSELCRDFALFGVTLKAVNL